MDVHWIPSNVIPSDEALGTAATDFVDFQA
jgi:hypothetical protein